MPQPKSTPAVTVPKASELAHGDSMVQEEITAAIELLRQQRDLQAEISANRDTLRLLDKRGKLSDQQGDWLDAFYPLKAKGERRSAEDIARTRQARADALGVSAEEVSADE